eukprot:110225_1
MAFTKQLLLFKGTESPQFIQPHDNNNTLSPSEKHSSKINPLSRSEHIQPLFSIPTCSVPCSLPCQTSNPMIISPSFRSEDNTPLLSAAQPNENNTPLLSPAQPNDNNAPCTSNDSNPIQIITLHSMFKQPNDNNALSPSNCITPCSVSPPTQTIDNNTNMTSEKHSSEIIIQQIENTLSLPRTIDNNALCPSNCITPCSVFPHTQPNENTPCTSNPMSVSFPFRNEDSLLPSQQLENTLSLPRTIDNNALCPSNCITPCSVSPPTQPNENTPCTSNPMSVSLPFRNEDILLPSQPWTPESPSKSSSNPSHWDETKSMSVDSQQSESQEFVDPCNQISKQWSFKQDSQVHKMMNTYVKQFSGIDLYSATNPGNNSRRGLGFNDQFRYKRTKRSHKTKTKPQEQNEAYSCVGAILSHEINWWTISPIPSKHQQESSSRVQQIMNEYYDINKGPIEGRIIPLGQLETNKNNKYDSYLLNPLVLALIGKEYDWDTTSAMTFQAILIQELLDRDERIAELSLNQESFIFLLHCGIESHNPFIVSQIHARCVRPNKYQPIFIGIIIHPNSTQICVFVHSTIWDNFDHFDLGLHQWIHDLSIAYLYIMFENDHNAQVLRLPSSRITYIHRWILKTKDHICFYHKSPNTDRDIPRSQLQLIHSEVCAYSISDEITQQYTNIVNYLHDDNPKYIRFGEPCPRWWSMNIEPKIMEQIKHKWKYLRIVSLSQYNNNFISLHELFEHDIDDLSLYFLMLGSSCAPMYFDQSVAIVCKLNTLYSIHPQTQHIYIPILSQNIDNILLVFATLSPPNSHVCPNVQTNTKALPSKTHISVAYYSKSTSDPQALPPMQYRNPTTYPFNPLRPLDSYFKKIWLPQPAPPSAQNKEEEDKKKKKKKKKKKTNKRHKIKKYSYSNVIEIPVKSNDNINYDFVPRSPIRVTANKLPIYVPRRENYTNLFYVVILSDITLNATQQTTIITDWHDPANRLALFKKHHGKTKYYNDFQDIFNNNYSKNVIMFVMFRYHPDIVLQTWMNAIENTTIFKQSNLYLYIQIVYKHATKKRDIKMDFVLDRQIKNQLLPFHMQRLYSLCIQFQHYFSKYCLPKSNYHLLPTRSGCDFEFDIQQKHIELQKQSGKKTCILSNYYIDLYGQSTPEYQQYFAKMTNKQEIDDQPTDLIVLNNKLCTNSGAYSISNVFTNSELDICEQSLLQIHENACIENYYLPGTVEHHYSRDNKTIDRTKTFFGAKYLNHHDSWKKNPHSLDTRAHGIRVGTSPISVLPTQLISIVTEVLVLAQIMPTRDWFDFIGINYYTDGTRGLGAHFDDQKRFHHPIITVTFLSGKRLALGTELYGTHSKSKFSITLNRGSILVLQGFLGESIKHTVRVSDLTGTSVTMIFRKIKSDALKAAHEIAKIVSVPSPLRSANKHKRRSSKNKPKRRSSKNKNKHKHRSSRSKKQPKRNRSDSHDNIDSQPPLKQHKPKQKAHHSRSSRHSKKAVTQSQSPQEKERIDLTNEPSDDESFYQTNLKLPLTNHYLMTSAFAISREGCETLKGLRYLGTNVMQYFLMWSYINEWTKFMQCQCFVLGFSFQQRR